MQVRWLWLVGPRACVLRYTGSSCLLPVESCRQGLDLSPSVGSDSCALCHRRSSDSSLSFCARAAAVSCHIGVTFSGVANIF